MNPEVVWTEVNPDVKKSADKIVNGIVSDYVIILLCNCEVEYDGRAGGFLPQGNRTVMIKPDGNFLVIGATKHKPRNWQPTGSEINVQIEDQTLILDSYSENGSNNENLRVYCTNIHQVTIYDSGIDADVSLRGTEEDMHNRLLSNPQLIEEGLSSLEHEKSIDSGRSIDIFARDAHKRPTVIEVKRRRAQRKDVDQLNEYTEVIKEKKNTTDVRGILVAPSASQSVHQSLENRGLEFIAMNPKTN